MAATVGIDDPTPSGFLRWLADLKAEIGVPRSLMDTTVEADRIEDLVDVAIADGCHVNNPREVSRDDFVTIFTRAFA
jgi:alcohol dehydrogenase class IV